MPGDSRLLAFYSAAARDNRGRTLDEILGWSDDELEFTHDYIQWLFPLTDRSGFNPEAPVLDDATIAAFRERPQLRQKLHSAFRRMLVFYGFQLQEASEALTVVRAGNFKERSRNWLTPGNHNHLRLTRILKSLRLLGLEAESAALFRALESIYRDDSAGASPAISATTFRFWQSAAR
ncbi:MAG TPA: opioid growth factor receptor-related protein [Candidatus Acidoferrales bacterium]|nr:opioid growth factor receptor-related protein [Candidatus Acidoferrales bacterium]